MNKLILSVAFAGLLAGCQAAEPVPAAGPAPDREATRDAIVPLLMVIPLPDIGPMSEPLARLVASCVVNEATPEELVKLAVEAPARTAEGLRLLAAVLQRPGATGCVQTTLGA